MSDYYENEAACVWITDVGRYGDASLVGAPPGGNVNCVDQYGRTALMEASFHGHVNAMEVLLATPGIDVNKRDGMGFAAAHYACCGNHDNPRVAELLSSHGADMVARDADDWTPLHLASFWGLIRIGIVSFLLTLPDVCDTLDVWNEFSVTTEERARLWGLADIADMMATAVRFECDMSYLLKHNSMIDWVCFIWRCV